MRVLVIGATGRTGKQLVTKLLARGDTVTAFARRPADITETHERLRVVQGDVRDAASLERAVKAQDAVVSAFGPRSLGRDDIQELLMRHLIAAMKAQDVRRVVSLSAWGAGTTKGSGGLVFGIARALFLRHVFADKERGEALLVGSDLDWVSVHPGRLLDAPARGGVRSSADGRGLARSMTREDLAAFMIDQLQSDAWLRKSVIVGY